MPEIDTIDTIDTIAQLSFLTQGALERCAGAHGISVIQARLLGVLRDRKPTMNELARLLGLDKSSASGLVDRAQRRGLVRRLPSQIDRRSVRVALTDAGRELVETVAAEFRQDMTAVLDLLAPQDRAALTRMLSAALIAHAADHGVDLLDTAAASASTE